MAEDAKKATKSEKDTKSGKDDTEEGAAASAPAAPAGKSNLMLIIGALALVIVSAGAPTAFFMLKGNAQGSATELSADAAKLEAEGLLAEGHNDEEQLAEDEERLGAILPLETFLINLDGGRYLRAQVQIEFVSTNVPAPFIRNQVVIRDGLISLMSRKKADEISVVKARDVMKSEIRDLINEILKREEVKRVYFTQFVIQ